MVMRVQTFIAQRKRAAETVMAPETARPNKFVLEREYKAPVAEEVPGVVVLPLEPVWVAVWTMFAGLAPSTKLAPHWD